MYHHHHTTHIHHHRSRYPGAIETIGRATIFAGAAVVAGTICFVNEVNNSINNSINSTRRERRRHVPSKVVVTVISQPTTMMVTVPDGMYPGMTLPVLIRNNTYRYVVIPNGIFPGSNLYINV